MKEKFVNFLKKKGAYDAFVRNFEKVGHANDCFEGIYPELYIRMAFVWKNTSEGHNYWRKLSHEWNKVVIQGLRK